MWALVSHAPCSWSYKITKIYPYNRTFSQIPHSSLCTKTLKLLLSTQLTWDEHTTTIEHRCASRKGRNRAEDQDNGLKIFYNSNSTAMCWRHRRRGKSDGRKKQQSEEWWAYVAGGDVRRAPPARKSGQGARRTSGVKCSGRGEMHSCNIGVVKWGFQKNFCWIIRNDLFW